MIIKKLHGQTLIEVMLALGLAVLVLPALLILSSASTKLSTSSLKRSEANKLASSGVEAIRFLRDTNGIGALSATCYSISESDINALTPDCNLADASTENDGWVTYNLGNNNIFERQITVIDQGSSRIKKITATVKWKETSGTTDYKTLSSSAILSDWR